MPPPPYTHTLFWAKSNCFNDNNCYSRTSPIENSLDPLRYSYTIFHNDLSQITISFVCVSWACIVIKIKAFKVNKTSPDHVVVVNLHVSM